MFVTDARALSLLYTSILIWLTCIQSCQENNGSNIFKYVQPLSSFASLTTNIHQTEFNIGSLFKTNIRIIVRLIGTQILQKIAILNRR